MRIVGVQWTGFVNGDVMPYVSVQLILMSEVNIQRVSATFVHVPLITEQKEHRLDVPQDRRQRSSDDPSVILRNFDDERCVYKYEPETKHQTSRLKLSFPRLTELHLNQKYAHNSFDIHRICALGTRSQGSWH